MNEKTISRNIDRILVYAGVHAAWNVISAAMILFKFPSSGLVTLIFYAMIVFISLSNLSSLITWIVFFGIVAASITINLNLWGMSEIFILNSGLLISVFFIATVLSRLLQRAYRASQQSLGQYTGLIKDNVVYDLESGLMRWKFASDLMNKEIARSRKSGRPLSVILLDVPDQKSFPNQKIYHPKTMVSELFQKNLETEIDIPFTDGEFGVILPEKNLEEAEAIAWEIVEDMANILGIDLTVGVASILSEEDTQEAIIERAKSALFLGLEMHHAVVTDAHVMNQSLVEANEANLTEVNLSQVANSVKDQDLTGMEIGINEWVLWLGGIKESEKTKLGKRTLPI